MVNVTLLSETLMAHLSGGSVAPLLQRATSCAGTAHYDIQTPSARLWQISFHLMHFTLKKQRVSQKMVPLSASRLYDYPGTLREGCIEVNGWNACKCEGGSSDE